MNLKPWFELRPWRPHSLVLFVGGMIYVGFGFAITTWTPTGPRAYGIKVLIEHASLNFWAFLWVLVGCLAVLSSRWPLLSEKWGYVVLSAASGGWSGAYLVSYFVLDPRDAGSITGALVWGLVTFLWISIARLMNPDDTVVVIDDGPS